MIHINEAHDCWIFDNGIGRCPHIKSVKVRYVVPTGALVGIYEDLELRDGGSNYLGKCVSKVRNYIVRERSIIRFVSYFFFC